MAIKQCFARHSVGGISQAGAERKGDTQGSQFGAKAWAVPVVPHRIAPANIPYVSLAYITDIMKPVYVDCLAQWIEDLDQKQRIWDLFKHTPPPLGYDPEPTFGSPTHENFGLLKLTPWRIALMTFPAESHAEGQRIWRMKKGS